MDLTLWSQIPLDALSIVIENTQDSETLKAWVQATRYSTLLHLIAIKLAYSTFTICEKNLLRAPDVTRHSGRYTSIADDEVSDRAQISSYQKLAPHVRRLHLQFYFASSNRQQDLVRSEDVSYTLGTIIKEAKALQEIDHHGVLYQEELDAMLDVQSLKVLRVRQSWNDTPCSCSEGENLRPRGLWTLDLSRLFHLDALKNLSVSQVHNQEAVGLARAVRKLRKLESLRVEVGKGDLMDPYDPFGEGEDSPLMMFIITLCCQQDGHTSQDAGLPSSLKALALAQVTGW